jgi:hypothetical protein
VVLLFSVAVAAQQAIPPAPTAAEGEALKERVRIFEATLKFAVERGSQEFAAWARQQVPSALVTMTPASPPIVSGAPLPKYGLVFDVKISEIVSSAKTMYLYEWGRQRVPPLAQPNRPVATAPLGAGTDTVAAPTVLDPDSQYAESIRQALINAILDGASVLPIRTGESLAVVATPLDVAVTNVLDKNPSRKLILIARGEDLMALQKGELSREEMRQKIVEVRF